MIDYISEKQLSIFEFKTPFSQDLNPDNRWVTLAQVVPWELFANQYISLMNTKHGRPGISPRIILGALIIKHKENLSDEKTIQAIQENVYMQFFVGLEGFQTHKVFDSSLFVTIRKRIGKKSFDLLNEELIRSLSKKNDARNVSKKADDDINPPNKGKMQADATVADQYITFPTDAKLLNSSRKKLDEMIDKLYQYGDKDMIKPRTYKNILNTAFLNYSKKKNKKKSLHRKMNRKLLESVNRNINFVKKMLPVSADLKMGKDYPLAKKDLELLKTIEELYSQQKQMYDEKINSCKNRIVSIFQPHVRPILRGKQNARVEFGSKLGVSLDNGFAHIFNFSWNAYHEGKDLIGHVEQYKELHGYYPDLVQVDKAYSTRENRKWLTEKNIRITAPPLGRKPKKELNQYQKTKKKREAAERNHIEAKFGQGKNAYNLNKIRAKLKETSESWVSCIFFVMNLINYQKKSSSGSIFNRLFQELIGLFKGDRIKQNKISLLQVIFIKDTSLNLS
jgi:IS5 family transposase